MSDSSRDRRTEPRTNHEGSVTLVVREPFPLNVTGKLVDISPSGFRAVHDYPSLSPGDVVTFEHSLAAGEARVIWRRIQPQNPTECDCGFFVLTTPR